MNPLDINKHIVFKKKDNNPRLFRLLYMNIYLRYTKHEKKTFIKSLCIFINGV